MNSSHLVTSINTHQHKHPHHNTNHHPHTATSTTMYTKTPTMNSNSSSKYNNNTEQSLLANRANSNTTTTSVNNVGAGTLTTSATTHTSTSTTSNSSGSSSSSTGSTYKFAPARRLAARQTLRLAIPKQPGDTQNTQLNSLNTATVGANNNATAFKHSSPSQLPPAPILKRTPVNTPQFSYTPTTITTASLNPNITQPKSASPLESHNLPNVLHYSTTPACTITPSSSGTNKFLRVRNPNITLNSSDVSSSNDLFAFAKDFSSPAVGAVAGAGDHSPIFAEIASSISPSTSSSDSPSNHLSRLFNLSPSTIRNYTNMLNEKYI